MTDDNLDERREFVEDAIRRVHYTINGVLTHSPTHPLADAVAALRSARDVLELIARDHPVVPDQVMGATSGVEQSLANLEELVDRWTREEWEQQHGEGE